MDGSISVAFVVDSIKKYFIDHLQTDQNILTIFDKTLTAVLTDLPSVNEFTIFSLGSMYYDTVGESIFPIHCCTTEDTEGWRLVRLVDKVVALLIATNESDNICRIPLYDTTVSGNWQEIGKLLCLDFHVGGQTNITDATKYQVITVTIKWPMKI